jgi:uncharacterized protein (AIM24 family)
MKNKSKTGGNKDPDAVLHVAGFERTEDQIPKDTFYAITGHESQVLTVRLAEGEMVRGEPGTMFYLSNGISQQVGWSDCASRCCTGEACCVVDFTNTSTQPAYTSLTPSFPTAKVVPVDLTSSDIGGVLVTQKGAFMASYGDVRVQIDLDTNCLRCCCGGMGLIRQRLVGSGTAFISSTGTMVQKVLKPGETILVDTFCLLAYAGSCTFTLKRTGGILGMIGGGEGMSIVSVSTALLFELVYLFQLVSCCRYFQLEYYRSWSRYRQQYEPSDLPRSLGCPKALPSIN